MDDDYKKLAQLCVIIETNTPKKELILEKFLQLNGHVLNHQIPENKYFKLKKPNLIGDTPLHCALKNKIDNKLATMKKLIDLGADFTIRNSQGETVFYQIIQEYLQDHDIWKWKNTSDLDFVDMILSALVKFKNMANPSSNDGISHFHIACMLNHTKAVELFLDAGVSVDQAVNFDSPILPGYTPLHFAATYFGMETVKILLKHGANVHLEDAKGMSVLQMLVDHNMILVDKLCDKAVALDTYADEDYLEFGKLRPKKEFKELKITDFENIDIFREKFDLNKKIIQLFIEWDATKDCKVIHATGLSNLHIACCLQDFSMTKQLLKSAADLDHCINMDSLTWPGYTAFHFAAHFDFHTVKLLLSCGANILAKDATGMTPFDLCSAKYDLHQISVIIDSQEYWKGICFSDSKTELLDFISSMKKTLSYDSFLNKVDVNMAFPHDSNLWPGYTLLHLSVTLSQRNSDEDEIKIKKMLDLGADITVKNGRGLTPLHLAFYENKMNIVDLLLVQHPDSVNPVDDNGFSHLHIACIRGRNVEKVINGPNINSPLKTTFTERKACNFDTGRFYPALQISAGSTPLHVIAIKSEYSCAKIFIELIEHGADIYAKDIDGLTPLHHVFMTKKNYVWDATFWKKVFSMSNFDNSVANCGLSHLHIASYMKNATVVERMLDLGADVNAIIIHTSPRNADDVSSKSETHMKWVEKNPDYPHDVISFLKNFTCYTPLDFALSQGCYEVASILLRRGADILMKKPDGSVSLSKFLISTNLHGRRHFFRVYKEDENMQKYIEKETGLTILHIACSVLEFDTVAKLLNQIDVNSRTHSDSPVWPGFTPLHVLVVVGKFCSFYNNEIKRVCQLAELLIDRGAGLELQNEDKKTPLHEVVDQSSLFQTYRRSELDLLTLMLRKYKKYAINPVDAKGISHFHIACLYNDITSVKGFLEHGVDVNQAINYFVESCGGYTPLHLAAIQKSRETIILLLQYNADVNAKNLLEESPIQTVAFLKGIPKEDLDLFIEAGADINGKDLFGETPLESYIRKQENGVINFLSIDEIMNTVMNFQCRVNAFYSHNQQGFIGREFESTNKICRKSETIRDPLLQLNFMDTFRIKLSTKQALNPLVRAVIDAPHVNDVDFLGRSVIHNIVSANILFGTDSSKEQYIEAIEEFTKAGFDIDHQDNRGYTPLHIAVYFKHSSGIKALLINGADWNLFNKRGKTAYAYLGRYQCPQDEYDFDFTDIHEELYRHFKKLQILELHISSANKYIISHEPHFLENDYYRDGKQNDLLLEASKATLKIIEPYPIKLHDFLSETGIVSAYAFKSLVERQAIDNFFHTNHAYLRENFPGLVGILYLQYRKAVARKNLIEPTNTSLIILSGFDLPHLCSEAVLKFLSNDELKNVIASTNDE